MPLKKGFSKSIIASNISHCISLFKKTGKVSNSKVSNMKDALKQCSAMAYSSAKVSLPKSKTRSPLVKALQETK